MGKGQWNSINKKQMDLNNRKNDKSSTLPQHVSMNMSIVCKHVHMYSL